MRAGLPVCLPAHNNVIDGKSRRVRSLPVLAIYHWDEFGFSIDENGLCDSRWFAVRFNLIFDFISIFFIGFFAPLTAININ